MTDMYGEIFEDLGEAIGRLAAASSERLQRRAMREALGHLYTLRAHHEKAEGKEPYHRRAHADPAGRVVEGLVVIRGELVHDLVGWPAPELRDVFADAYTEMYDNLVWLEIGEMPNPPVVLVSDRKPEPRPWQKDRIDAYKHHVAGKVVIDTLNLALPFLAPAP
ncbi:hypothetical protein I6A60_00430 [Frankia sp. AgB1.9]|uniref:hypothetical protein n=1 Tax=unclassified Frankia TaxID=2632575 RepID=UPI001931C220|nr:MULTISPECIES: hypothetical protein [unclassified Frankia]MBL7487346.1 hypothetical protein [Frankia sp. AgW1.1]MBL7546354.1 hypothetical protein [Frankia sp. AgB1.9]MBL7618600.1 hypothetical protein [Frankia sp. AgB1.8]